MRRAVAAVAIVIGCGDNISPSLSRSELEPEMLRAQCERYVRCGLFAEEAPCIAYFRRRPTEARDAAVEAGIVQYDGISAQLCVDALAKQSCDVSASDVRQEPPACDRIFTGTLETGEDCALDEECISGRCNAPACIPTMCCAGTCDPPLVDVDLGAACDANTRCPDLAFCGKDSICHPLRFAGQPCDDESHCDYGLGCIGATELQAGTCRALPRIGEACPYRRCADLGAVCDSAFVCVELGLPGGSCTSDASCSPFTMCDSALDICVETPSLGMPCINACAGEAWCQASVCAAPLADNEPCGANTECASLYCAEGPIFDYCAPRAVCL